MNTYSWLIRREFWENRAIWIIPTVIGIALTLAALFGRVDVASLPPPSQTREYGGMVLFLFGVVFFAVMSVYSTWYLLDCLHADRKDRSILFWKSLPVSDTATVLAKLLTGLLVIPFVYFLAADATTLLIAFIVSVRAGASVAGALWHLDVWLQLQVLWLYLIVTVAIWYLPFSGWLLVVSASAKRAVVFRHSLPRQRAVRQTSRVSTARLSRQLGRRRIGLGGGRPRRESRPAECMADTRSRGFRLQRCDMDRVGHRRSFGRRRNSITPSSNRDLGACLQAMRIVSPVDRRNSCCAID
jgi:ABC-2 type transport system permease protein